MPGLNGTGPMGEGPATGGGFGTCAGRWPQRISTAAAWVAAPVEGPAAGAGNWVSAAAPTLAAAGAVSAPAVRAPAVPAADRPSLETEAAALKARLEMLERRIADLETPESEPRDG